MDFTLSAENVEFHRSRAWTHAVLRASEARCDNNCEKKPARGVSEQARDTNKIYMYCCVVESMTDFMQD